MGNAPFRQARTGLSSYGISIWASSSCTLAGHADWVCAVAVTPDGKRAVSASQDQTLKVWDLERGVELLTLAGHTAWVSTVKLTPDVRRAVSASQDGTVRIWISRAAKRSGFSMATTIG